MSRLGVKRPLVIKTSPKLVPVTHIRTNMTTAGMSRELFFELFRKNQVGYALSTISLYGVLNSWRVQVCNQNPNGFEIKSIALILDKNSKRFLPPKIYWDNSALCERWRNKSYKTWGSGGGKADFM